MESCHKAHWRAQQWWMSVRTWSQKAHIRLSIGKVKLRYLLHEWTTLFITWQKSLKIPLALFRRHKVNSYNYSGIEHDYKQAQGCLFEEWLTVMAALCVSARPGETIFLSQSTYSFQDCRGLNNNASKPCLGYHDGRASRHPLFHHTVQIHYVPSRDKKHVRITGTSGTVTHPEMSGVLRGVHESIRI